MRKRGFTLIELLGVIVVLAIIALIATSLVTKVISKAEKTAIEKSANNYLKAVELLVSNEELKGNTISNGTYLVNDDGSLIIKKSGKAVKVNGKSPNKGSITVSRGAAMLNYLVFDEYVCYFKNDKISCDK